MDDEPSYDISVSHDDDEPAPTDQILTDAVAAALRRHEARSARIHVALVNDASIAALNERHLHHVGATDVLAFDLNEADAEQTAPAVDGEIVVSVETAAREARERGHDPHAELALYAVHGTLHLLGYDDKDKAQAARMHRLEDEILASIGLGAVYKSERA